MTTHSPATEPSVEELLEDVETAEDFAGRFLATYDGASFSEVALQAAIEERDATIARALKSRLTSQGQATREQIARIVYDALPYTAVNPPKKPAWVPGGNSLMQDVARDAADAILALSPTSPVEPRQPDAAAIRKAALEEAAKLIEQNWKGYVTTEYAALIRSIITADKQEDK